MNQSIVFVTPTSLALLFRGAFGGGCEVEAGCHPRSRHFKDVEMARFCRLYVISTLNANIKHDSPARFILP